MLLSHPPFTSVLRVFRAALVLAVVLITAGTGHAQDSGDGGLPQSVAPFVPGRLLVRFSPPTSAPAALGRLGLRTSGEVGVLDVQVVDVRPGDEMAIASTLRARDDVLYAEPDYILHALDTIPDDPGLDLQWGLPQMRTFTAWDIISSTGGKGITIAVVDTGLDLMHPDFACGGKLASGYDFVNNDCQPQDDDWRGHGTHVSGIAGACTDNAIGVAGVAWAARLMPVKVLDSVGSGTYSNLARGITYAVDHGADVINLSLGGVADSQTMASAVGYATQRGVLVIAAAGNCAVGGSGCGGMSNPIMYPAAYPDVLAVAATDDGDGHAYFSEYHDYVDVSAPGVDIYSSIIGGYGSLSGTSMSTPFASGLAALAWSLDTGLAATRVRSLLEANADDLGSPGKDIYFGNGRLNAWRTLQAMVGVSTTPATAHFLVDDDTGPLPAQQAVTLSTSSRLPITWTASISATAPWVQIAPPASGQVTAAGGASLTLSATRPVTYGTYLATVVIASIASSGAQPTPTTLTVTMHFMPQLYRQYLFPVTRNAPMP